MPLYPLPPTSDFITTGETKATFKGALSGLRAFLNSMLGQSGSQADALTALGSLMNGTIGMAGAGTVISTHRGKMIDCTGAGGWTLAVDAVATLGAGFAFGVRNSSTGTITINPNLSEQIDGASTITLAAGESCIVVADATAAGWKTVGRTVSLPSATASNDGYMTSTYAAKLDGIAAGANVGVGTDIGVLGVGMFATMRPTLGVYVASGATVAGSALLFTTTGSGNSPGAGTWRNISNFNAFGGTDSGGSITGTVPAAFQRIS